MKRHIQYIIMGCAMAMAVVLFFQFCWIKNFYSVTCNTFEKEVNMAFEDALKKEFSLRCDTIQQIITQRLMDTTEFKITGQYSKKQKQYIYTVSNAHNLRDKFMSSFSFRELNKELLPADTAFKRKIASRFAFNMRTEDLENHVVYYRTQNLGNFINHNVRKYDFDTLRLRPVLTRYLSERGITVPFKFYLRQHDSTFNNSKFAGNLSPAHAITTKAYPTYNQYPGEQFVRALFTNPFSYIVSRMGLMLAGSLLIVAVVAFTLTALMRLLIKEKRLSAIKNDFISNITHEFKTPIATASAAIEALTDFDVLDDKVKARRYLLHSKSELEKLSVLVDKVLNSSLYENKQFDITPETFNADAVVKQMAKDIAVIPGKTMRWHYTNNTGTNSIKADKLYFQHAVSNVIDNAVKYAGDSVVIAFNVSVKSNFWLLTIADNGIGIDANNLPLVFEKFYRVPSGNKHRVKGHGLGLSYVKNIIERHGGWCKIESQRGKGVSLTLAWPL